MILTIRRGSASGPQSVAENPFLSLEISPLGFAGLVGRAGFGPLRADESGTRSPSAMRW